MEAMESIIDEQVDPEDLKKHRRTYEEQVARGSPSARAAFTYAHCLVKSSKSDAERGIKILEELISAEDQEGTKREYIFYLAMGHTRLNNYDVALKYVDALLRVEPNNKQVLSLREVISDRMKKRGLIGAAVLGGGALVVGGIVAESWRLSPENELC